MYSPIPYEENCVATVRSVLLDALRNEAHFFLRERKRMEYKLCTNCGNPLRDGDGFCMNCGTRVGQTEKIMTETAIPDTRPLLYYIVSNKKLSRALLSAYFALLMLLVIVACLFWAHFLSGSFSFVSPHWVIAIGALVIITVAIISYNLPANDVSINEIRLMVVSQDENVHMGIRLLISWAIIVPCVVVLVSSAVFIRGYFIAFLFCFIATVLYIIGENVVAKRNRAIAKYFCGGDIQKSKSLFLRYDKKREMLAYEQYLSMPKIMRGVGDAPDTSIKLRKRCKLISVMIALFVIAAIVVTAVASVITDKFSSTYANKSALRQDVSAEDLRLLYGNINFIRPTASGGVVEFYDEDWLDLYEESIMLSKLAEKGYAYVTMRMAEIAIKMSTMKYDYLAFYIDIKNKADSVKPYDYFAGGCPNINGTLTRIMLDKKHGGTGENNTKLIEDFNVVKKLRSNDTDKPDEFVEMEIWYKDGSYQWRVVPYTPNDFGVMTISDDWGIYTITI